MGGGGIMGGMAGDLLTFPHLGASRPRGELWGNGPSAQNYGGGGGIPPPPHSPLQGVQNNTVRKCHRYTLEDPLCSPLLWRILGGWWAPCFEQNNVDFLRKKWWYHCSLYRCNRTSSQSLVSYSVLSRAERENLSSYSNLWSSVIFQEANIILIDIYSRISGNGPKITPNTVCEVSLLHGQLAFRNSSNSSKLTVPSFPTSISGPHCESEWHQKSGFEITFMVYEWLRLFLWLDYTRRARVAPKGTFCVRRIL